MTSEGVSHFWKTFCEDDASVSASTPYQVWHFGNAPEMALELANLVLTGRKTATASLRVINELHPEETPQPGGYSVVTDFEGRPLCIIQTVEIRHLPFNEVDAKFAADEGEGDLSLDYWRRVHWDYFTDEAKRYDLTFNEHSEICCERFRLVFP